MIKKRCSKCDLPKDITEFSKAKYGKNGLRSQCKASGKKWYEANPEKIAARHKKYSQTEAGKASIKKNRQKRRALKIGADCENFNPVEVLERDGYRCQACGKKTRPDFNQWHPLYPHLDHIVPLSKGGEHTKQNTQCLCRECNLTKHNTGNGDQLRMFG